MAPLSAESRFAIRRANWLRAKAVQMAESLGRESRGLRGFLRDASNAEDVAGRERARLAPELAFPPPWKSDLEAFRDWRARLERHGILVLQLRMPLEEVRGFSIGGGPFPAIVVNPADAVVGRIFTLFHEYAHLGLDRPGICVPDVEARRGPRGVEKYCNAFAGSLLVPRELLDRTVPAGFGREEDEVPGRALARAAALFRVSREVILRRLLDSATVSLARYREILEGLRGLKEMARGRSGGYGERPARRAVRERGPAFASLVLDALDHEAITARDAVEFLGVPVEEIEPLRAEIRA
ncbi:MAG: ImmA/IrrE family metallo-endopeptidase [Planctomycetes bacterium]|nr:ImmA/IrrE family metallo-endopeptidase [Planctomycetota bacterium]